MKPVYAFDEEVYKDYFLASFKNVETGELHEFEMTPDFRPDFKPMWGLLRDATIVTFNGNNFDIPLLGLLIRGAKCSHLKAGANAIIEDGLRPWQFENAFGIKIPTKIDHIDLIEVAPGIASLKIYGGRLHCRRMQDLPIEPNASIAENERPILRKYCANDLETTIDLYKYLLPQIRLREQMGAVYGLELRSKSDAQIAEAVIVSTVSKVLQADVKRPVVPSGTTFRYHAPEFLQFTTPYMQRVADLVADLDFTVPSSGAVLMPQKLKDLKIEIGRGVYQMGIGGLHSTEKSVSHVANLGAGFILKDWDVASYYPEIILKTGLTPSHMGEAFTRTYQAIVKRRLEAKQRVGEIKAELAVLKARLAEIKAAENVK